MGYYRLHTHRSYQVPLALEYFVTNVSLLSSAFMQETCHDLLRDHLMYPTADLARDHVSIRPRNYDCLLESEDLPLERSVDQRSKRAMTCCVTMIGWEA